MCDFNPVVTVQSSTKHTNAYATDGFNHMVNVLSPTKYTNTYVIDV